MLARAIGAGVERLLVVGFDLASSRLALQLADQYDQVFAAVGIHPESAIEFSAEGRDELVALTKHPKVVAIGEIGLDYHWETFDHATQRDVFCGQIQIASESSLPVIVHCRDAYPDTLSILEHTGFRRAVLHCFCGDEADAARAVDAGALFGIGGVATFKKNSGLRRILATLPQDRVILETDSPYLAPQSHRGKRNEPSYLPEICATVAAAWNQTTETTQQATTENAYRFFGLT